MSKGQDVMGSRMTVVTGRSLHCLHDERGERDSTPGQHKHLQAREGRSGLHDRETTSADQILRKGSDQG